MSSILGMSCIVPAIVLVVFVYTGRGIGNESFKNSHSLLPTGFGGSWDEKGVRRDVWGVRGSSVLIPCPIPNFSELLNAFSSDHYAVNVTWVKDDLKLSNRRSFVTPDGHLNITKLIRRRGKIAPENDAGLYRCILHLTAEVFWEISSPPLYLHVADFGRSVNVLPINISVVSGEAVRLSCQINSDPPAVYRWLKVDGGQLPQDGRFSQLNKNSGVLQISNIQMLDAGSYKCQATNELLNRTRESVAVQISVNKVPLESQSSFIPPSFLSTEPTTPLRVAVGHSATLECLATGLPPPLIGWKRKVAGSEVWDELVEDGERVSFSSLGNLHLGQVATNDAGIYACTAKVSNAGKQSTITQEIILEIITTPIIMNPSKNFTTLIAKTVRLNCSVTESDVPYKAALHISWYKNGYPVITDTRVEVTEENQLIFVNSITKDTGVYQCMVHNEAGYASSWSYLLVNSSRDHPDPPHNLRYFLLSPTSVLLEWDVVETANSNPIQAYSIHFTELGDKPTEFQFVSQTNSHLLKQLNPHTNYSFFVRAYSSDASDPSETLIFRTGEDVPLDIPDFDLQPTSHTNLLVTWQPLSPDKARGTITGYKVQWQRRSKDYYNLNEVGSDVFQLELKGLHPGKTYKVRVLARTKAGYNEETEWPWKIVFMPENNYLPVVQVPQAPLAHIQIIGNATDNLKGINISWHRPIHDSSPLDGYIIRYKCQNERWSDDITLPASSSSYVIRGLDPDWYRVQIRGFNRKGEGLSAIEMVNIDVSSSLGEEQNKTIEEGEQMPTIDEVTITPESQTMINLSWKVNERGSKKVNFFTIKRKLLFGNGNQQPVYTRSTGNSITVDDLTLFSIYEFSVRAHLSEEEYGPYSPSVETSSVGSTPRKLRYVPLDASTIELSWTNIDLLKSPPVKYQVIYSLNNTLPVIEWKHKEVDSSTSKITGLVSNTEYWFRVRGCSETNCGAFSESFPVFISAILPSSTSSSNLYIIIGLVGLLVVLLFAVFIAIYKMKYSNIGTASNPIPFSGGGNAKTKGECSRGPVPPTAKSANIVEVNVGDGDYIPMLNRIHTDISSAPLDTKGGYATNRVNGFANARCNGVVHNKEFYSAIEKGKNVDPEERQHLFPHSSVSKTNCCSSEMTTNRAATIFTEEDNNRNLDSHFYSPLSKNVLTSKPLALIAPNKI